MVLISSYFTEIPVIVIMSHNIVMFLPAIVAGNVDNVLGFNACNIVILYVALSSVSREWGVYKS